MRGHAHTATENFHRLRRGSHLHLLIGQPMRHAVEVPLHFDVIVEIDAGCPPLAKLEIRAG